MTTVDVRPISDDLSFGARVRGVTIDQLDDPEVRSLLNEAFEERGLLIFEDVDPTPRMQVAISTVFGPLKDHPSAATPRAEGDDMLGVIEMRHEPNEGGVVEVDGRRLSQWLPWHFDHCYNDQLNRAGVLRAVEVPEDGGMTGFVDGIALYDAVTPEVRDRIEGEKVIYAMDVILENLRFGRPDGFHEIESPPQAIDVMVEYENRPRAIHPAVWTRSSGEKVLHVSPWMAKGIEGQDDADGRPAAHRGVRRDRRGGESPQLLPSLGAVGHGHLGQLADPPLGVGHGTRERPVHAPHDHRRRLRPRLLRRSHGSARVDAGPLATEPSVLPIRLVRKSRGPGLTWSSIRVAVYVSASVLHVRPASAAGGTAVG